MIKAVVSLFVVAVIFVAGVAALRFMEGGTDANIPARQPSGPTAARSGSAPGDIRLIDFGAEWCAPCKIQEPIINNLIASYSGRVVVTKVDIDQNPQLAERYDIKGVPTIVIEKNGREARRFTGLQQENALAAALDDVLR